MVVDDQDDMRDLLKLQLEMGGDIVVIDEAADAESALDLTDRHRPDVIVLDESMPGARTGIEVIPDLVAVSPETVVIVYTANSGTHTREKVLQAGGHAVVGKSDSAELLIGTIHRLVPTADDPPAAASDEFGQRMTELLHRDSGVRPRQQTLRDRGIRPWFVVLSLLLLPVLIAAVWLVAIAMGFADR